jgi:HK97 family phage major capsid protein
MKTIEQIRAALAQATTDSERSALITELEKALAARSSEQPSELDQHRSRLTELTSQRGTLTGEYEQITTGAVDDDGNARDFTVEEAELRGSLRARLDQVDAEITEREDAVRQGDATARKKEMTDAIAQVRQDLGLGEQRANAVGGGVEVINEPRTYQRGNGQSYLLDLALARTALGQGLGVRSVRAEERLQRHGRENHIIGLEVDERVSRMSEEKRGEHYRTLEGYFLRQMIECHNEREANRGPIGERAVSYRALSTAATAGGEFAPPMYLTEEWIVYARPGRVLADLQHHEDLPDGTMSINIPKVTGGTSVGTQGMQNQNVSDTDLTTQFVTFPVVTKAGAQVISLQLLERSPISFDEVVGRDLALAYAQNLNESVGNGTGVNGEGGADFVGILNTTGINVVTWTQGTPTLKGLYGRIGTGKVAVATGRKLPATDQVMTSSCWEWIDQTFDTTERPVVVPQYAGPFNAVTVGPDGAVAEGTIGRKMQELGTYVDLTLPTNLGSGKNQDVLIGGRFDENYLYESPITTRMLPQTYGAQLSMLMQLYGYAAFTAARYPVANFALTGTGMSTANRTFGS